jgi:hypothetical protein
MPHGSFHIQVLRFGIHKNSGQQSWDQRKQCGQSSKFASSLFPDFVSYFGQPKMALIRPKFTFCLYWYRAPVFPERSLEMETLISRHSYLHFYLITEVFWGIEDLFLLIVLK